MERSLFVNITGNFETEKGLTIYLQGAIDSVTAPEAEEKIMALRKKYPEGNVILDAEELRYVSSSGLRVFLKLCKQEKGLKSTNGQNARLLTDLVVISQRKACDPLLIAKCGNPIA